MVNIRFGIIVVSEIHGRNIFKVHAVQLMMMITFVYVHRHLLELYAKA